MAVRTTRRQLLIAGASTGALVAADTFGLEPRWLEVTRHTVPIERLPSGLNGFTIAHLTDVHLHAVGTLHHAIARALHAHTPQLVVLTGDILDSERAFPALVEMCDLFRAPGRTIVATLGNWEHWGGVRVPLLRQAYARAGVTLLGNEHIVVDPGLLVVATDDAYTDYADPVVSFRDAPRAAAATLFLTHAPVLFDQLPPGLPRWDLALAGHTHGGQVRVGTHAIWVPTGSGRFTSGTYATAHGRAYVSRGIGTSVLPVRLMCRPELPIFTLVRA